MNIYYITAATSCLRHDLWMRGRPLFEAYADACVETTEAAHSMVRPSSASTIQSQC